MVPVDIPVEPEKLAEAIAAYTGLVITPKRMVKVYDEIEMQDIFGIVPRDPAVKSEVPHPIGVKILAIKDDFEKVMAFSRSFLGRGTPRVVVDGITCYFKVFLTL